MKNMLFQYLNDGIGTPCAGHVRATPVPNFFLKADKSTIEENLGLENPMGSNQINEKLLMKYFKLEFLPKCRNWYSLCWAR